MIDSEGNVLLPREECEPQEVFESNMLKIAALSIAAVQSSRRRKRA